MDTPMTPVSPVSALLGFSEAKDLLSLVANPEAALEALQKMEKIAKEINTKIELKGTVDEIRDLRGRAQGEFVQACEERRIVRAEADAAREVLAQERAMFKAHMQAQEEELLAGHCERLETFRLEQAKLVDHQHDLRRLQAECDARQHQLDEKTVWAERLIETYQEKLASMKQFLRNT